VNAEAGKTGLLMKLPDYFVWLLLPLKWQVNLRYDRNALDTAGFIPIQVESVNIDQ